MYKPIEGCKIKEGCDRARGWDLIDSVCERERLEPFWACEIMRGGGPFLNEELLNWDRRDRP